MSETMTRMVFQGIMVRRCVRMSLESRRLMIGGGCLAIEFFCSHIINLSCFVSPVRLP